jgi:phage/plasmid-like protein (TIGR03299 family)
MHGLEKGSTGQVAFATRAEPAWHLLGTVFDADDEVGTRRMLELAHLNAWDVRLRELENDARAVTPAFEVLRTNPFDAGLDRLAVVGGRYRVVQNEEAFAFADGILEGGGRWETAGSIRQGRVVFGSLLIDREVIVGAGEADDKVKTYLLVNTSHDGTVGVQASVTPVRVVCQNTLSWALSGVKQSFKVRHTTNVDGKIAAGREALGLTFAHMDAFEAEAKALYETSITNREFNRIITDLYPKPDNESKAASTRWENKVNLLGDIFAGNASQTIEDAPNTVSNLPMNAWRGLNAVEEYLDWYRTGRNGEVTSLAEAASGFVPTVQAEKQRIRSRFADFLKDSGKVLANA